MADLSNNQKVYEIPAGTNGRPLAGSGDWALVPSSYYPTQEYTGGVGLNGVMEQFGVPASPTGVRRDGNFSVSNTLGTNTSSIEWPNYYDDTKRAGGWFKTPETAAASNFAGGLSFSPVSMTKTPDGGWQTSGGFQFDISMATIAAFQNNAMAFTAANAEANRGFVGNVIGMQTQALANQSLLATGLSQQGIGASLAIANQNAETARAIADNALAYGQFAQTQETERTRIQIEGANDSGGGGCFFTTAVCGHWQMADDCEILRTMREFRDNVMLIQAPEMVHEYYAKAPAIVAKISARDDAAAIWEFCGQVFILPGIKLCKMGKVQEAFLTYKKLCQYLEIKAKE